MSAFATELRTHTCGELRLADVTDPPPGPQDAPPVSLCGHVHQLLPGGEGLLLRDRYGVTRIVPAADALPYVADRIGKLGREDVVRVQGSVAPRETPDPDTPTGEVEVRATAIDVLSEARGVPEDVLDAEQVPYDQRMLFRQVYLRRPDVQARMELRSRVLSAMRRHLVDERFLEVESPQLFLFDPVAEGGETVPVSPERAFALAGGPLVLNQYIRPGQFERFFQITQITAPEPDKTPLHAEEYTALDLNMDYVDVPDMCAAVERTLAAVCRAARGIELKTPFARLTYDEAMLRFGTDKPDLRFDLEIADLAGAAPEGRTTRAFRVPAAHAEKLPDGVLASIARTLFPDPAAAPEKRPDEPLSQREELEQQLPLEVTPQPGDDDPGLPPEERPEVSWVRASAKGELPGLTPAHAKALGAAAGDLVLLARAGRADVAARAAGRLRTEIGRRLGLADPKALTPVWIVEYPLFEWHNNQWEPGVVVFAAMRGDPEFAIMVRRKFDEEKHLIKTKAFDLVLDGVELATGFIGNHSLQIQRNIWEQLFKLDRGDLSRMRAPIEGHRFGVPPHGGLNLGIDRLVARLADLEAIDEVITFPKTQDCRDLLLGAPGGVPREAVEDLLADEPLAPADEEEDL